MKRHLRTSALLALTVPFHGACRSAAPTLAVDTPSEPETVADTHTTVFDYLLDRYDVDGDQRISAEEYTRHDGQFERWDQDGDGHLSAADWSEAALRVSPQIETMVRMDILGRFFQTDENEEDLLTIDELANSFFEYDEVQEADERLTREEFEALAEAKAITMPGDGSMMKQSYVGDRHGWSRLTRLYDADGDERLTLAELSVLFEELDVYEFRFDRIRFDDGDAGAHFESLAYEIGLPVGSAVPEVSLTSLADDSSVSLAGLTGVRPIALIFGSYT